MRNPRPGHDRFYTALRRLPLAAALALIAFATLVPLGGGGRGRFSWQIELPDIAINLALYFPLGLLLAREGLRRQHIALFAGLCSASVELLQGTVITGRRGSLIDVGSNLAGALLGALIFEAVARATASGRPAERRLVAAILALPVLVWLASGLALAPEPPPRRTWYSLWAHRLWDTERFRGTVVDVRLQDQSAPDGVLSDAQALLADAHSRGLRFDVTILSAGATGGPTQLASIGDRRGGTVIGLEQSGNDLMLFWASSGSKHGLRSPRVTFADAARAQKGERVTIHAVVLGSRASVSVQTDAGERSDALRLTPLTGWRSFIPSRDLSAGSQRLFDVVWTLVLAGYLLVVSRALQPLLFSSARRRSDPAA